LRLPSDPRWSWWGRTSILSDLFRGQNCDPTRSRWNLKFRNIIIFYFQCRERVKSQNLNN
jgi:hypothetical protein